MKKNSLFIIIIFLSITSLVSNYQVFNFSIDQHYMLEAVIYDKYDFDDEYYKKFEVGYPNLTATAIPIKSILGAYWINNDSVKKSMDFLRKGEKHNPYLGFSDMVFANIYQNIGFKDSFAYYTRQANSKLPNAPAHYALLAKLYVLEDKIDSLDILFEKIKSRVEDIEVWKVYLSAMVTNRDKVDSIKVLEYAKYAKERWTNHQINAISDYIIYGQDTVKDNVKLRDSAVNSYKENPKLGIKLMQQVVKNIPDNVYNYETLIEMLFFEEMYIEIIDIYQELNELNMTSFKYKTVELIAISYLNLKNFTAGCYFAKVLRDNNQEYSSMIDLVCK